jgi:lipocalin
LLEGKWYVVATNFSMWLDTKNTDPNFNYTNFREKNEKLIFDDCVMYSKNKNPKQIRGQDKQKRSDELKFSWRGKGLLVFFKSNWSVIASDKEGRWLAIYSTKTLVSPEGVDIIARKKNLSEAEIKGIISHLDKAYIKKPIEILK